MISPQEALRRWKKNAGEATESYKAGVQAVTENPAAKAAAAADDYARGVREAVESGRYQAGLGRVTLQGWKDKAANTGARRYADGIKDGETKMAAHLSQFLPFLAQVKAEVDAMPSSTEADRDARVLHQIRRAREYRSRT